MQSWNTGESIDPYAMKIETEECLALSKYSPHAAYCLSVRLLYVYNTYSDPTECDMD